MNSSFNISTAEIVGLTNKLEKLHRSVMPVTVRETLNNAAFEHRKDAIEQFKSNFIIRKKTFISSHMKVNRSPNTFDLKKMVVESGIVKGKTKSGDKLKLQEEGGFVMKRNIPTNQARIDELNTSKVQAKFYYKKFRSFPLGHINSQKGIKVKRRKKITFIKMEDRLLSIEKGGIWKTLYYIDRDVTITKDAFLLPAQVRTSKKLFRLYKDRAKTQMARMMNK